MTCRQEKEQFNKGARIVSHHFDMSDWKPEQTMKVGDDVIYLWRMPVR